MASIHMTHNCSQMLNVKPPILFSLPPLIGLTVPLKRAQIKKKKKKNVGGGARSPPPPPPPPHTHTPAEQAHFARHTPHCPPQLFGTSYAPANKSH